MEYVIDSELLIYAIEKRPLIWNHEHQFYKDRVRRRDAWIEICEMFFEDLDTKDEQEKVFISKQVELKWRHIRDNYTRYLRSKVKSTPRGKLKRRYIYSEQLEFLRKDIEQRFEAEEDQAGNDCSVDNNDTNDIIDENDDSYEPTEVVVKKKKRKIPVDVTSSAPNISKLLPFEESLISMEKPQRAEVINEDNDDMSFFRSLLPMLSTLGTQQKIKFRIEVMQELMKYHSETNMKFDYDNS